MTIEDVWLANLRALVEREGGDDKRKGYRQVALASGLSEEYVYQLCGGKPAKDGAGRNVGKRAAKKLAAAYAEGRDLSWFDRPIDGDLPTQTNHTPEYKVKELASRNYRPGRLCNLIEELGAELLAMDELTRDQVTALISRLLREPERAQEIGLRVQQARDSAAHGQPTKQTGT